MHVLHSSSFKCMQRSERCQIVRCYELIIMSQTLKLVECTSGIMSVCVHDLFNQLARTRTLV